MTDANSFNRVLNRKTNSEQIKKIVASFRESWFQGYSKSAESTEIEKAEPPELPLC